MHRLCFIVLVWLLAILFGYAIPVGAQEDAESLTMLGIDYEGQFPTIEVALRYTGAEGVEPEFQVTIGGQEVEVQSVERAPGALAVAIVADLSGRMSDKGTPVNNTRFDDMQSLLQSLMPRLLLPDPLVSMTVLTETVTVYHEIDNDVGEVTNIVNDRVDTLRFTPQQTSADDAPYPLEEAILDGLAQLEDVPSGVPRELIILAAGNPNEALDQDRLQMALTEVATDNSPLTLTVIALGSGQSGDFDTVAADPAALEQLAVNNGGRYFHYFDADDMDVRSSLRQDIETWFEQMVQRADRYVLRLTVPEETRSGAQTVQVTAGEVSDEMQMELDDLPPRVAVVVEPDPRNLQGTIDLSIHTIYTQTALTEVEYLLDNRSLGRSEAGPEFGLSVDVYSPEFQERFEAGEYDLVAAVRDAQGQPNRSDPLRVTVIRPQAGGAAAAETSGTNLLPMLLMAGGGIVLVVALVGVVLWTRTHKKAPVSRQPAYFPDDDLSAAIDEDDPTEALDDEKTEEFSDEKTEEFNEEKTEYELRFCVKVLEGLPEVLEFHLDSQRAHYYIGRPSTNGERQPDISLPHRKVSRSDHAKLIVLAQGGVQLTALNSQNGTFVGEEQRRLGYQESVTLRHGDVFWISPAVKLRLEED